MRQINQNLRPGAAAKPKLRVALMLDLEWPYRRHCDVYTGALRYAQQRADWECVLDEYVADSLKQGVKYDGVIARASSELAEQANRCRIPVVNVWGNSPAASDLPTVVPNAEMIGKSAAQHLLERGFRRFACMSNVNDRLTRMEAGGFHQAIEVAGFQCICAHGDAAFGTDRKLWYAFHNAVDKWIDKWQPPLGVFVTYPLMGRYVANACRKRGLIIPDEVAMIVCDNEPIFCDQPSPSLTSVDVDHQQVGFAAAEMLDQLMSGRQLDTSIRLIPPTGIVARQSTDFFAVDDKLAESALKFISENLHRQLQVTDVCDGIHVARRTLERRFHAALGRTVAEEIVYLRIQRAKRELAGTESSIKVISERSGFSDSKRMHAAFLRNLGVSPSQYREKLRLSAAAGPQ